MVNDNFPPRPIADRLRNSILEAIGMCMEAGLSPHDIMAVVDKIAEDLREDQRAVDR
jgi:hypothetical protein